MCRLFSLSPSNFQHCPALICFLFPSITSGSLSISSTFTSPSHVVLSLSCFPLLSLSVTKTSAFRAPNSFCRPQPHLSSSSRVASQSSWRPHPKTEAPYLAGPPSPWAAHAPRSPSASPPLRRPPPASAATRPPTCCQSMHTVTTTATLSRSLWPTTTFSPQRKCPHRRVCFPAAAHLVTATPCRLASTTQPARTHYMRTQSEDW